MDGGREAGTRPQEKQAVGRQKEGPILSFCRLRNEALTSSAPYCSAWYATSVRRYPRDRRAETGHRASFPTSGYQLHRGAAPANYGNADTVRERQRVRTKESTCKQRLDVAV
eukprot:1852572-Pleurochrysis_carterae.AAC.10